MRPKPTPKSLKNLEKARWKPGQSGNPKGKPKGTISLRERLERLSTIEVDTVLPDGSSAKREVIDDILCALIAKGRGGDVPALKEYLERLYGKEVEKRENTNNTKLTVDAHSTLESLTKKHEKDF